MAVLFLLLWRGRSEMVAAEEFVMVLRDLTSFIDFQGHRESASTCWCLRMPMSVSSLCDRFSFLLGVMTLECLLLIPISQGWQSWEPLNSNLLFVIYMGYM